MRIFRVDLRSALWSWCTISVVFVSISSVYGQPPPLNNISADATEPDGNIESTSHQPTEENAQPPLNKIDAVATKTDSITEQGSSQPSGEMQQDINEPAEDAIVSEEQPLLPPQKGETIVVTGSRIARSKLSMPVPVTVIDAEFLEDSGALFLADIMAQTPQIQPSFTSANSTRFIGTTGFGGTDLRNLGINRTLVLVNGRRHVGGIALSTAVDLNTIPTDLVERFEVLTGGASATYGADAVAGVVNIILKDDFEGSVVRSQYGISERGDAANWFITGTIGNAFADNRGHAALSFEYTQRSRLRSWDRDFTKRELRFIPNPADTDRTRGDEQDDGIPDEILTIGGGVNFLNRHGIVNIGNNRYTFNPDGTMRDFNFGERSAIDPSRQVGGDILQLSLSDLLPEQDRIIATSLFSYQLTEKAKLYAEAKLVFSTAVGAGLGQPSFDSPPGIPILRDNAFLPDNLAAKLDAAGLDSVGVSRFNNDLGLRSESLERTMLRAVMGLKGDLNQNISYDIGFTWGRTNSTSRNNANRNNARFLAASDAVVDENGEVNGRPGEIVCRVNLQAARKETPTLPDGTPAPGFALSNNQGNCIPMSVFGFGGISDAAASFINAPTSLQAIIEQIQVLGFFSLNSKDIFELPAGPISLAIGGEYRRDEASQFADLGDSLGITFFNAFSNSKGAISVAEAFGELSLPIAKDLPGIEELTVTAGGRVSTYDLEQVGTVWTAQVNGVYRPLEDLAIRGSYALAIRAPNVGDAFSSLGQSFSFISDPCDEDSINNGSEFRAANCAALAQRIGANFSPGQTIPDSETRELLVGGNPDLEEETSTSWTVGFQFNPQAIPRLFLSVDYYSYIIDGAIGTPGAQRIANNCVDQQSIDNQYCGLITRNPSNFEIDLIQNIGVNLASLETEGIDFSLSYALKIQDILKLFHQEARNSWGLLRLNFNGNYLLRWTRFPDQSAPDERLDFEGFVGQPKFRWTLTANYDIAKLNLNYRVSWIDGINRMNSKQDFENNPDAIDPIQVDAFNYHYVQARYQILEQLGVYAGIDNLFDTAPPIGFRGNRFGSAFYDNILRRYYVGARWNADIF